MLTPKAKQLLSITIRGLRDRLLRDIRDEAERRYHLSVSLRRAHLSEEQRKRRRQLESWIEARVRASRPQSELERSANRRRILELSVKEAGTTLINRLVLLRQLEAIGLSRPAVVTGGFRSTGYREFRDFAQALLDDETEGYGVLLKIVFDDLAVDLPGLFGNSGLIELLPIPPATLREVVTQLDDKELEPAWTDDTTLGWVYQYWNDPEREALDAKIGNGEKIEPQEIAPKTQMFTERYMVEWLLQNSLGVSWLRICKKNGWKPDAERVIDDLATRRAEWRQRRAAGQVAPNVVMPIRGELENAWKYYVPQPISEEAAASAPDSVRSLTLLDPACGSGHFLVIAFDLLVLLHREEARHREESVTDEQIAESILANNLYGVDIDPRAVQTAAAALYLKAKTLAASAHPSRIHLVAPALRLGDLEDGDPSLVRLRQELKRTAGIPFEVSRRLVSALGGVDHWGTLLQIDSAVDQALVDSQSCSQWRSDSSSGSDSDSGPDSGSDSGLDEVCAEQARSVLLDKMEQFLAAHSSSDDLGVRLDGAQLASGVRFMRLVRAGRYDVVVGNPPYLGTQRLADSSYLDRNYRVGKEDLYAAFILRSLQLARDSGIVSLVTVRSWMFVSHFREFREWLLDHCRMQLVTDLGSGGFEAVPGVEATMLVVHKNRGSGSSMALRSQGHKTADLVCQSERFEFSGELLRQLPGSPIVYQWTPDYIRQYLTMPRLGQSSPARVGMKTSDNTRFVRAPWEVNAAHLDAILVSESRIPKSPWVPYIKGAGGKAWLEPLSDVVRWSGYGLEIRLTLDEAYGHTPQCERLYFVPGVAFTTIARRFLARAHRYRSIFDVAGSSVFHENAAEIVCLLNSERARQFVEAINPTINFQVGDVNRLPMIPIPGAREIFARLEHAFSEHEHGREPSVEFRRPGPSAWRYAQTWAQKAVDRLESEPLPAYEPEYDAPHPESLVSFGVGVALGRFRADHSPSLQPGFGPGENGLSPGEHGLLPAQPEEAAPPPLPVLFVSPEGPDSLDSRACSILHAIWREHGRGLSDPDDLRTYLRKTFFAYHQKLYQNRPIYLPLSSAKRNYVAYVSIHRFRDDTLALLLADYLLPEKRRLSGELADLHRERNAQIGKASPAAAATSAGESSKNQGSARRLCEVQKLLDEIHDFIDRVRQIAERGPPAVDAKTPEREVDAPFVMDLDDGVMVTSAALWPLLDPQWSDPKTWWKELAAAQGRRDYDWAHLAARYFPGRVRDKCSASPSLAVAHKCLWHLHPAVAYAWELRLSDAVGECFTIEEPGSDEARTRFLADHPEQAARLRAAEAKRQDAETRRRKKDSSRAVKNG